MTADDDGRTAEAEGLLARLNEWDPSPPAGETATKSTGESRARIALLERALAALGAQYARRNRVFVLVGWTARGSGGRRPDVADR